MIRIKALFGIAVLLCCLAVSARASDDDDNFPLFDCIKPNVNFWITIYGTYSTSQAVVHDSIDLDLVYDVIDIKPYDAPGSRAFNRKTMDRARAKYSTILKRLGAGHPPSGDPESERIAALFGEAGNRAAYRRAAENIRCQIGQKDRFLAGLIRSGAYIDEIRDIFRSYRLPEDLAYLPHVESSFNTKAYSKFGAAGMWQFTRSTGQRFMEVGYVLDERRDPIRATHAAARLLKENYLKLEDWPLALTAYNHGAAGMQKAKQHHGDYPRIFKSYHSRIFKFASRNFYSEFLAARHVATHYREYFGEVVLDQPRPIQTVVLEGYCSFEKLQAHFELDAEVLQELNPALRPPVFNGQKLIPKGYVLNLPRFSDRQQTPLIAAIPAVLYQSAQMPSRFYTVKAGDSAGKIAKKHGVRLETLLAANDLTHRSILYPRQTLRIPHAGEAPAPKPAQQAELPVLAAAESAPKPPQAIPAEPPVERTEDAGSTASSPNRTPSITETAVDSPTIRPENDKAPVAVAALEPQPPAQPEIEPQTVLPAPQPEIVLAESSPETLPAETEAYPQPVLATVIPIPAEAPLPEKPYPSTTDAPPNFEIVAADVGIEELGKVNGVPAGQIQLEIEETLGHLAEWADVRTQKIRNLNGLRFGEAVQLGQKIKIPLNRVSASEFAERRYEYHKRLQEDFFAVYRVGQLQPYQVQRGDNYWNLCRDKFDIPMWLLKHCNPEIDLARLVSRQTLLVPMIEKTSGDEPGIGAPDETEADSEASSQIDEEVPEKNDRSQDSLPTS